ncbi:MAG: oxidoreductase [Chloroflexi bacterium]|nr:MAG: oxidoreductase [Chloroflexota bacterium]
MRRIIYGVFWVGVYLILILTPLVVLLIGPTPPGRSFWRELSVALGFVGLAMLGIQFFLTARVPGVTRPYGIDVIYHFHRQISLIAFAFVLAHPLILFIESPETLILLNPLTAPARATAGVIALLLLAILIVASVWRLRLRINYEAWRLSHGILATAVVALAVGHVVGVGYYVGEPYKRILWIVLSVAWVSALVYTRLVKPLLLINRPYQVEEVTQERGDTWTLALRPEGHKGMTFRPGQFAWLTIWRTPFSIREHPFSFSSSAMHPERLEFSIKELGDFTRTLKEVTPGTRAYLDGPYGVFTLDYYPAPGYVFIAGGVGITPVVSMLRTAADRRDARPFLLIYGSPTWEGITFREELEELEGRLNLRVCHVLEQPPEGWTGETGFVTADLLARHLPDERLHYEYFICGPEPMLNAVDRALDQLGIPIEQTHAERFNLV